MGSRHDLPEGMMRWFKRWYGANPLHLLTMLACFALAAYAAARWLPGKPLGILLWLAGAVIGHDLLLMPLYTLADRSVMAVFGHRRADLPAVGWINYLRVPVVLSGILLLMWFPLILRLPKRFQDYTTLSVDPYLGHWLAVTGALFLLSALVLAVRIGTGSRRRRRQGRHTPGQETAESWPEPDIAPGYPERGYPGLGYPEPGYPERGYPERGFPERGYPEPGYPERGYRERGFPEPRYPEPRYPEPRYPERGYPEPRYPERGYPEPRYPEPRAPELGYPEPGYPERGYPEQRYPE
ncbi:MAG: hypothetical protein ACRDOI_09325 [Trebonia sp.]